MAWINTENRKSLRVKLRIQETYLGIDYYQYFDGVTGQTGTGFTYNSTHWLPLTYGTGGSFARQPVGGATGFTERLRAFSGYTKDVLLAGNSDAFNVIDWSKAYELAGLTVFLTTGGTGESLRVVLYEKTDPLTPDIWDGSGGTEKLAVQNLKVTVTYHHSQSTSFDYNATIIRGTYDNSIELTQTPHWNSADFDQAVITSVVAVNDNDEEIPLENIIHMIELYYLGQISY